VAQVGDAGQAKPHLEHNPLSRLGVCHAIPIRKLNGPGFFAFKEGMWDTHISVLWGSPTVTHEPGLSTAYENREAIFRRVSGRYLEEAMV
jgi:hypothetical protein